MGSVSSLNPGVADLLQTLSNVNSPVLSSPATASALENAPTSDIVQLSQSAVQLENVDMLFGIPSSAAAGPSATLSSLLANVEAPSASTVPDPSSTTSSASTEAGQLASYQAALQSAETQTLFGTAAVAPDTSLLNLLG